MEHLFCELYRVAKQKLILMFNLFGYIRIAAYCTSIWCDVYFTNHSYISLKVSQGFHIMKLKAILSILAFWAQNVECVSSKHIGELEHVSEEFHSEVSIKSISETQVLGSHAIYT